MLAAAVACSTSTISMLEGVHVGALHACAFYCPTRLVWCKAFSPTLHQSTPSLDRWHNQTAPTPFLACHLTRVDTDHMWAYMGLNTPAAAVAVAYRGTLQQHIGSRGTGVAPCMRPPPIAHGAWAAHVRGMRPAWMMLVQSRGPHCACSLVGMIELMALRI